MRLQSLNIVLGVSAAVLGGYFFVGLTKPVPVKLGEVTVGSHQGAVAHGDSNKPRDNQLAAFDFSVFENKRLFAGLDKETVAPVAGREFIVVGVSLGERKLAVLKNTRTQNRYYCSIGDEVEGQTVIDITRDKVLLDSGSRVLEITR